MTNAQAEALLAAMASAGSDDPILILFGFTLIRSGAYGSAVVTQLGALGKTAVLDTGGFNDYLEGKIGATKMTAFRSAVQTRLGQYTSKIKDAVDSITDSSTEKEYKGQAAALLCDSASDAGFDPGYINAAMNAMRDNAETYLGSEDMGADVESSIEAVMGATWQKIKAESVREKYTEGLTTLNASSSQVTRMNTAITTLSNAMISAFQAFEEIFDEDSIKTAAEIEAIQTTFNTALQTAFNNFMGDCASTNAEIDAMITAMASGFSMNEADLITMRGDAAVNAKGE
ncbi:MAG: hypothetical protein HWN51_03420, partial [Desulfobacterales bacterium]|nr:hypothetical protein [Desulfobacterales bacterium]